MPRRPDPERVAAKRRHIATEASRLFAAQGFDRTSVSEVARAAGTSAASVFYYFQDKAALFRAAFESDLPASEALIARHADAVDPLAAILDVLEALAADAADPDASGMLTELLRRAGDDPQLLEVVGRTQDVQLAGLSALISRAAHDGVIDPELDPDETAAWLLAVVDAAYLNARPGHSPRTEVRRTGLGYLLRPYNSEERHV